jgi:hypothetical protein
VSRTATALSRSRLDPVSDTLNLALDGALMCAGGGYPVFPVHGVADDGTCLCSKTSACTSPGKHPVAAGWQQAATTDAGTILAWWEKYQELYPGIGCNFGIRVGDDVWAIEVDPYQGGPNRLKALRDSGIPVQAYSMSGRGVHVFGRGRAVNGQKLGPGLTVRSDGYLVVAPGSRHATGRRYGRRRCWRSVSELPRYDFPVEPENEPRLVTNGTIPAGDRHETLKREAGYMRRRGAGREAMFAYLKTLYETQCEQGPGIREIDDSEIMDIVEWVLDKPPDEPIGGVFMRPLITFEPGDIDDAPDAEVAPLTPAIPSSGYINEYVEHVSGATMIPQEFALASALAQMSVLLNGRVGIWAWEKLWSPALWLVDISHPGQLKTSAINHGMSLVDQVTGGFLRVSSRITPEALLPRLQEVPYGFQVHSEFAAYMKRSGAGGSAGRSYQVGSAEDLCEVFDGDPVMTKTTLQSGTVTVRYPALTMIGAATYNNFTEWCRSSEIRGGFLTRFQFVPQVSRSEFRGMEDGDRRDQSALTARLTELKNRVYSVPLVSMWNTDGAPAEMDKGPGVVDMFNDYDRYARMERQVPDVLEGFNSRLGLYVLKYSMGYALSRGSLQVDVEDIEHAIAFTEFVRTRAWPMIEEAAANDSFDSRLLRKFKERLAALGGRPGGDWVKSGDHLARMHMRTRTWHEYLETLVASGQVEIEETETGPTGGRPGKRIRLTGRAI